MYQVYCDGHPLHDLRSEELILTGASVQLEDNSAGSFEFSISPLHPEYENIRKLKSEIKVLHNGVEIFCGRPTEESKNFYNNKNFHCEGELNYFADSIQRPAEYHNITVRGFLERLVSIHNAQVFESNIAITFNTKCAGESNSWDYLYLYYVQNNKVYKVLDKVQANSVAGKTFILPTLDFYLWWHTDSSVNSFYGFSIDSVEVTDEPISNAVEISTLPSYAVIETSDITDVQTAHNPYQNNVNLFWHYTKELPDDYISQKSFKVGAVTVVDSNDSLYRYTNYETTLKCISDKLLNRLGGHIRVRKVNGVKYIDYLADYEGQSDQTIEFGKNLLDFSQTIDASDIATAVIPLGGKLEESTIEALEERLTIASVNNGCDFVFSPSAVSNYGWIYKTVTFDDVNVPSNLKRKGEEYLSDVQFESLVLECTAVDLNNLDVDIQRINILDMVRVVSEPHGLNRLFPVTKLKLSLDNPEKDQITLGSENSTKTSLTGASASNNSSVMDRIENIPSESSILKQAQDNASALITSATHGHVVKTANEQLIMDTDDIETAQKVWRWNLNGLGYSKTGYNGTYTAAITMDGQIVGDRLVGGSVSAEKLSVEYKTTVEKAIEDAESNANSATDNKLKSYYTKTQVTTAIQNSADSVLISAKEEAVEYTDNRLKNYSTSAEIKVKTDAIESTVSKKLNTSDFTTKLTQSYSYVRIAWNNCSRYIQFEGSALNIYDSNDYKLMSLTYNGNWFYREGSTIGMIGTNNWSGDSSYKGLVFDLESSASYMCWAAKDSANASVYTVKLIYHHKTSKDKKGLHFGCETYADGNLYLTDSERIVKYTDGSVGYSGEFNFYGGVYVNTSFGIGPGDFIVYNNVNIDFYSELDMHNYSIKNQSDARMKKNIQQTKVEGLKVLNGFDLKEFDWVQDDSHDEIGIIAQQLQLVAPELVVEAPDGHLSIKTTKFIFYLIKAVQELSEKMGLEYDKAQWSDPYTLLEKKVFCSGLGDGVSKDTKEEQIVEPIQLPIRK